MDCVTNQSSLNDPLADSPRCEAAIKARLPETRGTDHVVQAVVEAKTKRCAFHLGEEAQISQQVVEEDVVEGQNDCNAHEDDALNITGLDDVLITDSFDKPDSTGADEGRPHNQEAQFHVLDYVEQTQSRLFHP